jgi:hypothetical protein
MAHSEQLPAAGGGAWWRVVQSAKRECLPHHDHAADRARPDPSGLHLRAAIRAALANRLQRAVNVLLGSVLASIGLTIPLVVCVALITHQPLVLGLDSESTLMLVTTLLTTMLTFSLPRTNVLLGCVHLLLFGAYFMLLFDR